MKQKKLQELHEKYKGDLLIWTALTDQNEPNEPPTTPFCKEWTEEYGLEFPVMMDQISAYKNKVVAGGVMPVWYVICPDWTVKVRHSGEGGDLEDQIEDFMGACN